VVLFDGNCGFCRWSVGLIERWDRHDKLRSTSIQSEEGSRLLAGMPPSRRLDSFHLSEPGGAILSAGEAAAPLLRRLPGGRPIAFLTEQMPRTTERAYRFIANRRSFFGRLVRRFNRRTT